MTRDEELQHFRLQGRHGQAFYSPSEQADEAAAYRWEGWQNDLYKVSDEEARTAFNEGVEARATGLRCMCLKCSLPEHINDREHQRYEYSVRRRGELLSLGHSPEEVMRIISEEIDQGAALFGRGQSPR